jgi:hypothetical protein
MARARNPKFEWQSAFIESGLTGNTGFVGLLMSTFDNGDGKGFFLSGARISQLRGLNEKTARIHVAKLRDAGWINQTRRGGNRGGAAYASDYALTIPQAGKSVPEAEISGPEPERSALPIDQPPIDQPPIDPYSIEGFVQEPSSMCEGQELPVSAVAKLPPAYRRFFAPSFSDGSTMVYSPSALGPTDPEPGPTPARVDGRPEWLQRQQYEQQMKQEGLGPTGEPLRESNF